MLADTDGAPDVVTLSERADGPFLQLAGGQLAGAACPRAANVSFPGFQCAAAPLVRIDAGRRGPGKDLLEAGKGNDHVVVADGERDVVDCGPGSDVLDGVVDPNDGIYPSCESAQRTFVGSRLPKSVTVAAPSTVTLAIGRANIPLRFHATLSTAPPKHGANAKARSLARTTFAATTGAVKLTFELPNVSKGFLSKRPDLRVQVAVTAIGADGRRYPLQLHSQKPGPHPKLVTLYDNQVRLKIPARLRHPRGAG